MAELVQTDDGVVARATHQELFEALHIQAWEQIAQSIAMLASGDARRPPEDDAQGSTLTMAEDCAASYVICRGHLANLTSNLDKCPAGTLARAKNKATRALFSAFEVALVKDDIYRHPVDESDPMYPSRMLRFFSLGRGFVDYAEKAIRARYHIEAMEARRRFEHCVTKAELEFSRSWQELQTDAEDGAA